MLSVENPTVTPSLGLGIPADVEQKTHMSRDRRYRYELTRRWGYGPHVTFVLLNPSSTPVNEEDPTIRRCTSLARYWRLGGMVILNLYAYRSITIENLLHESVIDPIGPENDKFLKHWFHVAARHDMPLVFAWGSHALPERADLVRSFRGASRAMALGMDLGQPRHPLFVSSRTRPRPIREFDCPGRGR